jgi:signal transduction histidine kinase/CheY-like chemotaxis protein
MKPVDLINILNQISYSDEKKLKASIRIQMVFRYSICGFSSLFLYLFHAQLPFPFPYFFLVACGTWLANGLLHLLTLNKKWIFTAFSLFPYLDALTAPLSFQCSGGFLSPFVISHISTNIGSCIIYTRNKHLALHSFLILLLGYLSIAFLQKFGILSCPVAYCKNMMTNDFFFLFVVSITSFIIVASFILIKSLNSIVRQMLEDATHSIDSIIKGTTATVGRDFFVHLIQSLSESFSMRCIMIAELTNKNSSIHSLAVWKDGKIDENFDSPVQGTVFADVLSHGKHILDKNVGTLFQANPLVALCNAVFFCGVSLCDSKGKPIGVLCMLNNKHPQNTYLIEPLITIFASRASAELERKQTEEKQRTVEMQLAHAHKMEAIGNLVGGIAHDFNNMVSAIGGCAQLLKAKMDAQSPNQRYVTHILNAGLHTADLINRLTGFARRDRPQTRPIDTHKVIDETLALMETTTKKNITLVKKLGASEVLTPSDEASLQNVFLNIGINSCDSMENGGGTLTFETSNIMLEKFNPLIQSFQIEPGEYISVAISDTGIGMSDDVIQHLFEPFFTTKPKGKGTGLGLANVWGYVENYKCAIKAMSKPGSGATFTLFLPLVKTNSPKAPLSENPNQKIINKNIKNLLIVDDEAAQREIYKEILNEKGFSVTFRENGLDAVNFLKESANRIDCIILDLVMPVMNGHDAFYEIRKIDTTMKIIMASGFINSKELKGIVHESNVAFLQKPFSGEMLLQKIENFSLKAG